MPSVDAFRTRRDAGRKLAASLADYRHSASALVLALPRGGVPVAYEVATALRLPLDVFLVRKLGVPGHEELAMGAIATGGVRVLNRDVIDRLGISPEVLEKVTAAERRRLHEREELYRGERPLPEVLGRNILIVDDGLATGATMRAALRALLQEGAARVVVAVPVAPPSVKDDLAPLADDIVCLLTPEPFGAVGRWYDDFEEVSDSDVRDLLARAEQALLEPGDRLDSSPPADAGVNRG